MAGHSDTRTESIAAVTTDMARLLAVATEVCEVACAGLIKIDQVAAVGRTVWPVAPKLKRRGLSGTIRQAYDGAKRAGAAFATLMNSVAASTSGPTRGVSPSSRLSNLRRLRRATRAVVAPAGRNCGFAKLLRAPRPARVTATYRVQLRKLASMVSYEHKSCPIGCHEIRYRRTCDRYSRCFMALG